MEKELSVSSQDLASVSGTGLDTIDPKMLSLPQHTSPEKGTQETLAVQDDWLGRVTPEEHETSQDVSYGRDKSGSHAVPDEKKPWQSVSYGRDKSADHVVPDENKPFQNVAYGRQTPKDEPSWGAQKEQGKLFESVAGRTQQVPSWPVQQQQSALFQNVRYGSSNGTTAAEHTTYKPKSILPRCVCSK